MSEFQLPAGTGIGRVHLRVADLERALDFYREGLGFREVEAEGDVARLSATGHAPLHVVLTELPGARRKPRGTTGLYHVAIRFPSRRALAWAFRRLVEQEWPFQGFADHLVSEALYLADPEGNGLELYVDRPRDQWPRRGGQIQMATDPLDVEALLAEAGDEPGPGREQAIDPGTDVGHVHLQVSDLGRAEAFYGGLLGLEVTQRGYPGALFLSAGGYHHHVGLNVWAGAGASRPPSDAVGLVSFALRLPEVEAWRALVERVRAAGVEVALGEDAYGAWARTQDPDGNGVELLRGE
ncbi:MAG: VOC family protein [Anaerolineae bacterium]